MSDEEPRMVTMSAEEFELRNIAGMYAHNASGLEDFAKWLRDEAGRIYAAGKRDHDAGVYRVIAEQAEIRALVSRKKQAETKAKIKALTAATEGAA